MVTEVFDASIIVDGDVGSEKLFRSWCLNFYLFPCFFSWNIIPQLQSLHQCLFLTAMHHNYRITQISKYPWLKKQRSIQHYEVLRFTKFELKELGDDFPENAWVGEFVEGSSFAFIWEDYSAELLAVDEVEGFVFKDFFAEVVFNFSQQFLIITKHLSKVNCDNFLHLSLFSLCQLNGSPHRLRFLKQCSYPCQCLL